jgi:alkylation response protein AidB-like acyl-CoA dehydrogenase
MRDLRINLIFEGSSEIMRLFIAREAVDPHLQRAGAMVDPEAPFPARAKGALALGGHFAAWVPGLLVGRGQIPNAFAAYGRLAHHLRFVERATRRLGRMLFLAMARFGPQLEKRQSVLFRLVDVGAELFAMSAVCVRANTLMRQNPGDESPGRLADLCCRHSRQRVRRLFGEVFRNSDTPTYRAAQEVLEGRYAWLEEGLPE